MDILYVWPCGSENQNASGEVKKGKMQMEAFRDLGLDCEILNVNVLRKFSKIFIRLPFYETYNEENRKSVIKKLSEEVKAVYIRKSICDRSFIKFVKEIRFYNKNVKIIFEIPTYPYDAEWSSPVRWPLLIKDRIYRRKLKRWIDRIVIMSKDEKVFGVQCINIDNGIDCRSTPVRIPTKAEADSIKLLAVAWIQPWHGYDRVIQGLGEYYQSNPERKVEFRIVGDGAIVKDLKKLCHDLNVGQYVFFHGWMHGKELDDMFDQCDIGVGSLGMYRTGFEKGNTLKLREYTARGIPFVYGYTDELIEFCVKEYTLQVPNNHTPLDIQEVLVFYDNMQKKGFEKIAEKMHKCAEKNMSWTRQMKPVVDYILSNER